MNRDVRITTRLNGAEARMLSAAADFEDRKQADLVRVALNHYFNSQGYYDEGFIARLAMKGTK